MLIHNFNSSVDRERYQGTERAINVPSVTQQIITKLGSFKKPPRLKFLPCSEGLGSHLHTSKPSSQVEGRHHKCLKKMSSSPEVSGRGMRNQKFSVKIQKSSRRANFPSHLATPFDVIVY